MVFGCLGLPKAEKKKIKETGWNFEKHVNNPKYNRLNRSCKTLVSSGLESDFDKWCDICEKEFSSSTNRNKYYHRCVSCKIDICAECKQKKTAKLSSPKTNNYCPQSRWHDCKVTNAVEMYQNTGIEKYATGFDCFSCNKTFSKIKSPFYRCESCNINICTKCHKRRNQARDSSVYQHQQTIEVML